MALHENHELFNQAVNATARYFRTVPSIVEKDYYLTLLLKELSIRIPDLLFKGGTSLSKCYKAIHRFSEDLDITLSSDPITKSMKRQMKQTIKEVCRELHLSLLNEEEIYSRRKFNHYEIDYVPDQPAIAVKPVLLVETTFIMKSYPQEIKSAASMIYDFMNETNQEDFVRDYELEPFAISVQSLERTLIDKVFAICDYYLGNNLHENSRHIYDINCLVRQVNLNKEFAELLRQVRLDRALAGRKCISACDEYNITELLSDIVRTNVFKKDYDEITTKILFDYVSYEEAVSGLIILINSGIFSSY